MHHVDDRAPSSHCGLQVSYRLLGLGLRDDGRGWTADLNPGQVLGDVDEEAGLGVEEELCGVDDDTSEASLSIYVGCRVKLQLMAFG